MSQANSHLAHTVITDRVTYDTFVSEGVVQPVETGDRLSPLESVLYVVPTALVFLVMLGGIIYAFVAVTRKKVRALEHAHAPHA